jgi:hypothetical protein
MDFSRPVSGAFYYAPPLNLIADLPESATPTSAASQGP